MIPTIVSRLSEPTDDDDYRSVGNIYYTPTRLEAMKTNSAKFKSSFGEANALVREADPKARVAYKFELDTTPIEEDDVKASKLGGWPDYSSYYDHQNETVEDFVERHWPRCGVCHQHMRFVGQVDVGDWLIPIHRYTCKKAEGNRYISSLGYTHLGGWELDRIAFIQFYYCPEWHFYCYNTHNAMIKRTDIDLNLYIESPSLRDPKSNLFEPEEILAAMQKLSFKPTEDYVEMPLLKVTGLNLRWDIWTPKWSNEALYELDTNRTDLFGDYGRYTLFGTGRTQQDLPEYRSQYGYALRSMTPVFGWYQEEHDMDHQIYADFHQFTHWSELNSCCFGLINSTCT